MGIKVYGEVNISQIVGEDECVVAFDAGGCDLETFESMVKEAVIALEYKIKNYK